MAAKSRIAAEKAALLRIYSDLFDHFGPLHWWPGETPFEVMVGAVLTQNTAWSNVERAIANLKARGKLDPHAIVRARHDHLGRWLKPSGYFNVKARRLRTFCLWYLERGGFEALGALPTAELRHALLAVNGIGPETADDILLYAFGRPVFVIDAYTRRIFTRLGFSAERDDYEGWRSLFESRLGADMPLFNEYHALIVNLGKAFCRPRPKCAACPLRRRCPVGRGAARELNLP